MKKIILISIMVLALPVAVLAAFKPATLYRGASRIAVFTETQAKALFAQGYKLEDKIVGGSSFYLGVDNGGVMDRWVGDNCKDASTTVISIKNPVGKDVIVDRFIFLTTGVATTTWTMDIGTSSTAFADPTEALVDDTGAATSAKVNLMNDNGTISSVYGVEDPSTNSQDVILWRSNEYIVGKVTTSYTGAFTEVTNSFKCDYMIHTLSLTSLR